MTGHENPALAGERRGAVFQDGVTPAECQNPAQTAIKILHWQHLGEVADVIARLSEPLYRASENRSPEMARACVMCSRDTAKAAIASFNAVGGAL